MIFQEDFNLIQRMGFRRKFSDLNRDIDYYWYAGHNAIWISNNKLLVQLLDEKTESKIFTFNADGSFDIEDVTNLIGQSELINQSNLSPSTRQLLLLDSKLSYKGYESRGVDTFTSKIFNVTTGKIYTIDILSDTRQFEIR